MAGPSGSHSGSQIGPEIAPDAVGSAPTVTILVVGEAGSGKSQILRELEARPAGGRLPLYVPIPTLDFGDLATWCLGTLGRPWHGDPALAFELAISRLAAGVLLLIDDADHLPPETASRLAALCAASDGRLAIVAGTCPGLRESELARHLRPDHRILLDAPGGALLHLGELHQLVTKGHRRAPMARVREPKPRARADLASELELAVRDAASAVAPETEVQRAGSIPIPARPSAPRTHSIAKLGAIGFSALLLLIGVFELGRRSALTPAPRAEVPLASLPIVNEAGRSPVSDATEPLEEKRLEPEPAEVGAALRTEEIAAGVGAAPATEASAAVVEPSFAEIEAATDVPAPNRAPLVRPRREIAETEGAPLAEAPEPQVPSPRPREESLPVAEAEPSEPALLAMSDVPSAEPDALEPDALDDLAPIGHTLLPRPGRPTFETASAAPLEALPDVALAPITLQLERRELPPRAPTGDGWIEVVVEGGGRARVWIDGETVGRTPVAPVAIPPGAHRVTLRLDGGGRITRSVDVRPGRGSRVRIVLGD